MTAHEVNVEGTLNLLEFAQHEAESHGRPVVFMYPSSIAAYGLPDLETKNTRRQGQGGRVDTADHDVRLQQAVLRAARDATTRGTTSSWPRSGRAGGSTSDASVSRADFGGDDAVRRDVGLRAGDDSRGGERGAVQLFRAAGHAHPVHGHAGWCGGAVTLAAAPREHCRGSPTTSRRSIRRRSRSATLSSKRSRGPHRVAGRHEAAAHRRFVAGGRRRWRGASRLGIRPALRFRSGLLGVPHPADPRTLSGVGIAGRPPGGFKACSRPAGRASETLRPDRRRVDIGGGVGPGSGRPLPVEPRDGADGHVVVADDLAGEPDAAGPLGRQHLTLGRPSTVSARLR